ncbi:MAG: 50S ribosomal protein L6 [Patescibacteria group bacterium]
MTRVGSKPIPVPAGVTVTISGFTVSVKGPKGTLEQQFHPAVIITPGQDQVVVSVQNPDEKSSRELWGLWRMLVANMVEGVTKGYAKQLEINGVGFRAAVASRKLTLQVGFSHPVELTVPEGLEAKVEKNTITISGIDKQKVGQFAAHVRNVKKPEPYKGKGIKYAGEVIRRKAGKVVKTAGAG